LRAGGIVSTSPKYLVLKNADVSADRKSAIHIVYTTDGNM